MITRVDCTSRAQYDACLASHAFRQHWELEQFAVKELRGLFGGLRVAGFCNVCRAPTVFRAKRRHVGSGALVDASRLRNSFRCRRCDLMARQRMVVELLDGLAPDAKRIYSCEQLSPFYRALSARYAHAEVTGSEYLGAERRGGEIVGGVRHEDLQALSFADDSFDLHVSGDVLEHVPDYRAALREAFRVLRPRGHLVLTIPFHSDLAVSRCRAELRAGRPFHHCEPSFHTNPIDRRGSLVFWDHGWDLLTAMSEAGFTSPTVTLLWSWFCGYVGVPSQVFWAKKA